MGARTAFSDPLLADVDLHRLNRLAWSKSCLLVGFGVALVVTLLQYTRSGEQILPVQEPAITTEILGQVDVRKYFNRSKGDDASAIRFAALEGNTRAMEIIALASSSEQRQATIDTLVALVDRPWHDDLIDTPLRHSMRMSAAAALGKVAPHGNRAVIDALTHTLMRRTFFTRHTRLPDACAALGKVAHGDPITIATLMDNMRKPPMQRQACAAEALIWALPWGDAAALPAFSFLRTHNIENTYRLKGEGFSGFEFASTAVLR